MGRHSLVEADTRTTVFEALVHPELAMLKQRGASVYYLGDRQRLGIEFGDDTKWLSPPVMSEAGDFTIQLAGAFVTPDGKAYGLSEAVRMRGPGADRRIVLSRLADDQYGQARLVGALTPGNVARAGSVDELGWSIAVALTGDTAEMFDQVSIQHNGIRATEYIGAAAGHVELANMLPANMWAPVANDVRWALRQPA